MANEYECAPAFKLMHTPDSLALHTFRVPNQTPHGQSTGFADCSYSSPVGIFQPHPASAYGRVYSNYSSDHTSDSYSNRSSNNGASCMGPHNNQTYESNTFFGTVFDFNNVDNLNNDHNSHSATLQSPTYLSGNTNCPETRDSNTAFVETPIQKSSCMFGDTSRIGHDTGILNTCGDQSCTVPSWNGVPELTQLQDTQSESNVAECGRKMKSARRNLRNMTLWNSSVSKNLKGSDQDCIRGTPDTQQNNTCKTTHIIEIKDKKLSVNASGKITPETKPSCRFADAKIKTSKSHDENEKKDCKRRKGILGSLLCQPLPVGRPILYTDKCDTDINSRLTKPGGMKSRKCYFTCCRCCSGGTDSIPSPSKAESKTSCHKPDEQNKTLLTNEKCPSFAKSGLSPISGKQNRNGHVINEPSECDDQKQTGKSNCSFSSSTFLFKDKKEFSHNHGPVLPEERPESDSRTGNDDTPLLETGDQNVEITIEKIERKESASESYLCFGCQKPVFDRYVLHVRDHGYWHAECLKCSNCQDNLSTHKTCYVKNEQIFCRNDYNILFGLSCVKCSLQFKKEQDWMRVAGEHRYHIACFLCKICKRQLGNNEKYHLVNGTDIYCTNHYRDMVSGDSSEEGQQPTKKAKRNRTSYTEAQIKFLQERFMHDSNPDGNELEKIANHINLKKRVVQVWFQNNRARLKKSANNNKGGNPDNAGQSTNNGRVTTPGSLHESLTMDWDNSLDPSSLEDQGYVSPSTTPSQQHHHQQQLRSASSHFNDSMYGMAPLMCLTPSHTSLDPQGDGPRTGISTCGPAREQQLSPSFTDIPNAYHTSGDPVASPSVGNLGLGRGPSNGACDSNSGSGSDTQGPNDSNNNTSNNNSHNNGGNNANDENSHCLNMASPIASFRSSLCGDKPFGDEPYRRLDSRDRHEQQIRQMMLYHEQQQQQQQQHQYQLFGGPPHHMYGGFSLGHHGSYNGYPGNGSIHQSITGLCNSPQRLNETPQNFLQIQQQQQQQPIDKSQQQQQSNYQMLSPAGNDTQQNGSAGNGDNNCANIPTTVNGNSTGDKSNHLHHQHQQQQQHRDNYDVHIPVTFGGNKNLTPPTSVMTMGVSTQSSPLTLAHSAHPPASSPSHFGDKRSLASPDDFSKVDGYRSPVSFNARGTHSAHPYHFIPVNHAHRQGVGSFYGNDGLDTPYGHRADCYSFGTDVAGES